MKNGELKIMLERFDRLESKMDRVLEEKIPQLETKQAVLKTQIIEEAKAMSKIQGTIWGGITLVISLAGLVVAYFKH